MPTYVTCPRCRQRTTILKSGDMRDRRTANYAIGQPRGGRVRELCAYSGVTLREAADGITPLRRRILGREAIAAAAPPPAE